PNWSSLGATNKNSSTLVTHEHNRQTTAENDLRKTGKVVVADRRSGGRYKRNDSKDVTICLYIN
ncbi:hypothetical protein A2U01_0074150, partial [Trifolium medium]|nr:hypothetical protein [Trifolium medium]